MVRSFASLLAASLVAASCATSPPVGSGPITSALVSASPTSPASSAEPDPSASGGATGSPADISDVGATEGVLNTIWIEGDVVVAGGFSGPAFDSLILVFGDDGWSIAQTPTAPGQVTAITGFEGGLIAVGNGLPDVLDAFVWGSADGRAWDEVAIIKSASLHDVVATDRGLVAVGAQRDAEANATAAAWSSSDGVAWQQQEVPGAARTAMGTITATPDGLAASGDRALGQPRPFWTSAGESPWRAVENDLDDQRLPIDLVYVDGHFVLIGASGRSGDQHPWVAVSETGQHWDETNLSTDEGYASAVAIVGDGPVVAGVDADRLTVWREVGSAWEAQTLESTGASISDLFVDAERGLLAVGAKDGHHAVWSIVAP